MVGNGSGIRRGISVYPVLIDPDRGAVLGAGDPLPLDEEPDFDSLIDGMVPVWPVRSDGQLGRWGVGPGTLRRLISSGYLSRMHQEQIEAGALEVVGRDEQRNAVDVRYSDPAGRRVKTVWHRSRHDAGAGAATYSRSCWVKPASSSSQSPSTRSATRSRWHCATTRARHGGWALSWTGSSR